MIRPFENNKPFDFSPSEKSIDHLPDECMLLICKLLSSREILAMEQVNSHHQNRNYIKESWKGLFIEKKMRVNWSNLFPSVNSLCIEKFNYRSERAIQYFLNDRRRLVRHIKYSHLKKDCQRELCLEKKAKKIYKRFESVSEWNVFLATYILDDLLKIGSFDCMRKLDEDSRIALVALAENTWRRVCFSSYIKENNKPAYLSSLSTSIKPGPKLLQGLSALTDYQLKKYTYKKESKLPFRDQLLNAHMLLTTAIDRGAPHASLLARKIMRQSANSDFEYVLIDLAMRSAARKEYRALEKLCLKFRKNRFGYGGLLEYIQSSIANAGYKEDYPPLLIFYAACIIYKPSSLQYKEGFKELVEKPESYYQKVVEKAESLFNQGIESYQRDNHPIFVEAWLIGAKINRELEKWTKADAYMDAYMNEAMLMTSFEGVIDYPAWKLRAEIKENLGDVKNAIFSLKQILEHCEDTDVLNEEEARIWDYDEDSKIYMREVKGDYYRHVINKEELQPLESKLTELQARYKDRHH